MSQGRLGRQLGLTFSQVQKYEKGTNRIGAGRLFLLAFFLGVPIKYFFEGLDETPGALSGGSGPKGAEVAALEEAFLSIPNGDTRRSLLALVNSLAVAANAQAQRPPRAG